MLRKTNSSDSIHDIEVIRDFGLIIIGVDLGTIVRPSEPNYALISSATSTMRKVLTRVQSRDQQKCLPPGVETSHPLREFDFWAPQTQLEPWGFEFSFWQNLGEHPSVFDPSYMAQG